MATDDAPNLRRLARQLVDVTRRLKHLETVPQLAHSSLDDHGLPVYDADGNLALTVGKQPDGTWGAKPVVGPVPPAPVGLDAEGDAGAVRASWQGVFWAGAALPMDFEAVQVLVDGLVYAAIHDPQGGSVSVPAMPGERVVSFRTLSQAGAVSEVTVFGNVTVEPRVSEQMLALGENLSELRDVTLPELSDELDDARTDLQQKLDAANARIDDIVVDGGGSGNFTTYSINEPSGEGTGEGDQWFRVVNGEVIGQWRWDGSVWQAVTLTDAIIAGIDLSKLVSNGNLSEVVANKMFADLFTANKITSQELAVGAVTAENIASGAIRAESIEGGSFTGETFEGGTFTGGLFKTSDALPGQVQLSDDAYVTHLDGGGTWPGIRVVPIDTSDVSLPAAIGPSEHGLTIFGGRNLSGGASIVQSSPAASFMRTFRDGGSRGGEIQASPTESYMRTYQTNGRAGGEIQTSPNVSYMRTYREDGGRGGTMRTSAASSLMRTYSGDGLESGWVQARPQDAELAYVDANNTYFSQIKADASEAFLYTRAGGSARYLSVDADGVWVKRRRGDGSGQWDMFNLLGDDWGTVDLSPAWAPRATGGYFKGLRVRRLGGSLEINGAVQGGPSGSRIGTIVDPSLRPTYDTFVVTTLASGGLGQAFVGANGDIMHSYGADKPGFLAINVSIPLN